jgi:two-component system chemotaxis response regulator CheB
LIDTVKILVVDDNVIYRKFISHVVEEIEGVELTIPAANGKIALARLRQTPVDLILMDIQMPEMDGLETLLEVRKSHPEVGVVMMSATYPADADMVIRALESGALDFFPKTGLDDGDNGVLALRKRITALIRHVQVQKNLQRARLMAGNGAPDTPDKPTTDQRLADSVKGSEKEQNSKKEKRSFLTTRLPSKIDVIVIGASTGGPNALGDIIPRLPVNLDVPILLVQHMPPSLTASLATSLDSKSKVTVMEAKDGQYLTPNTVFLAPGGHHMVIDKVIGKENRNNGRCVRLNTDPPENSVRPSVDVLLRSLADAYRTNILVVIMTGMGNDGLKGISILKERGSCYCMTQSEETCVVYGMPRAVDEACLSDERTPLDLMAERITHLTLGNFRRM